MKKLLSSQDNFRVFKLWKKTTTHNHYKRISPSFILQKKQAENCNPLIAVCLRVKEQIEIVAIPGKFIVITVASLCMIQLKIPTRYRILPFRYVCPFCL